MRLAGSLGSLPGPVLGFFLGGGSTRVVMRRMQMRGGDPARSSLRIVARVRSLKASSWWMSAMGLRWMIDSGSGTEFNQPNSIMMGTGFRWRIIAPTRTRIR